MSLPVAILAGGLATRLRPLTESMPKSLVDVGGRPFVEHQIELLRNRDVTDIVFLVGHLGEMIQAVVGDGSKWNVQVRYVFDGARSLGTGGAIRNALAVLPEAFFVLQGDGYLECDYAAIAAAFLESGKLGLATVFQNDNRYDRSNMIFEDGRILRYDKRHRVPAMRHIDYGLAAFHRTAFAPWEGTEEFDLGEVYRELIEHNQLGGFEVSTRLYEIGSPQGLDDTRAHLMRITQP
jgi:N-acetyl-alpha-D-muramate 1-phosphate uridylyltransferase